VLKAVYERQLDGAVTTIDEARAEARRVLAQPMSAQTSTRPGTS
jgi:hypothetical protein